MELDYEDESEEEEEKEEEEEEKESRKKQKATGTKKKNFLYSTRYFRLCPLAQQPIEVKTQQGTGEADGR